MFNTETQWETLCTNSYHMCCSFGLYIIVNALIDDVVCNSFIPYKYNQQLIIVMILNYHAYEGKIINVTVHCSVCDGVQVNTISSAIMQNKSTECK